MAPLSSAGGVPGENKRNGHPGGMSFPSFNKRYFKLTEELFNFQLRVKFQTAKQWERMNKAAPPNSPPVARNGHSEAEHSRIEEADHSLQGNMVCFKNKHHHLGIVAHSYNPRTWKVEPGRSHL